MRNNKQMRSPEFGGQAPTKVMKGVLIVVAVLLVIVILIGISLGLWLG